MRDIGGEFPAQFLPLLLLGSIAEQQHCALDTSRINDRISQQAHLALSYLQETFCGFTSQHLIQSLTQ